MNIELRKQINDEKRFRLMFEGTKEELQWVLCYVQNWQPGDWTIKNNLNAVAHALQVGVSHLETGEVQTMYDNRSKSEDVGEESHRTN